MGRANLFALLFPELEAAELVKRKQDIKKEAIEIASFFTLFKLNYFNSVILKNPLD